MIRHIFMFRFKPEATEQQKNDFAAEMNALKGKIPGVINLHAGKNLQWSSDKTDMIVIADLPDRKAWDAYLCHPLHLELGNRYFPLFDTDSINGIQLSYDEQES